MAAPLKSRLGDFDCVLLSLYASNVPRAVKEGAAVVGPRRTRSWRREIQKDEGEDAEEGVPC